MSSDTSVQNTNYGFIRKQFENLNNKKPVDFAFVVFFTLSLRVESGDWVFTAKKITKYIIHHS